MVRLSAHLALGLGVFAAATAMASVSTSDEQAESRFPFPRSNFNTGVCITAPLWGSALLLAGTLLRTPDLTTNPEPTLSPSPASAGAAAAEVQKLQQQMQMAQQQIEIERKRTQIAKEVAESARQNATLEAKKLQHIKGELATAKSKISDLQRSGAQNATLHAQQLERLEAKLQNLQTEVAAGQLRASPVMVWFRALAYQKVMAVIVGIVGILSVAGPSPFVRCFLPIIGSLAGGLLVASCVDFLIHVFSDHPRDSLCWVDFAFLLVNGNGQGMEYTIILVVALIGIIRWLMRWDCFLLAIVDEIEVNPRQSAALQKPLLDKRCVKLPPSCANNATSCIEKKMCFKMPISKTNNTTVRSEQLQNNETIVMATKQQEGLDFRHASQIATDQRRIPGVPVSTSKINAPFVNQLVANATISAHSNFQPPVQQPYEVHSNTPSLAPTPPPGQTPPPIATPPLRPASSVIREEAVANSFRQSNMEVTSSSSSDATSQKYRNCRSDLV